MLARTRSLCAIAACVTGCWAQTAPALPEFEAATVKASAPSERAVVSMKGGPGTPIPGQFTCANIPLQNLILKAWNLKSYQLSGPANMATEKYDIDAKIPPDTSTQNFKRMLQRLLKERLGLVVHHESREQTVYELLIANGGLKMSEAEPAPAGALPPDPEEAAKGSTPTIKMVTDKNGKRQLPPGRPMAIEMGLGRFSTLLARMQGMPEIIQTFETRAGRPVIDMTGLLGKYDYVLEFASENAGPARFSAAGGRFTPVEANTPAVPFMTAIVQQLGLKLEPAKSKIDVLVVDRFHKSPADNQ